MEKILVCSDSPNFEFSSMGQPYHPTHALSNYFGILGQRYELYLVGYDHPESVRIPLSSFSATILWIRAPRIDWQPKPFIFIPDSSDMYFLQDLAKMDAVIAYCDEIALDAKIADVKCLHGMLPIKLNYFENIQVNEIDKDIAWTNKSVDEIRDAIRLVHETNLKLYSYTQENDREENRQEADFARVFYSQRTDWYKFAQNVANSFISLNTYRKRIALGAIAPIAAYAKRVSVGYPHAFQKYLYPNLTSYNPDELRELIIRLLNDRDFYNENAEYAHHILFSLESSNFEKPIVDFVEDVLCSHQQTHIQ